MDLSFADFQTWVFNALQRRKSWNLWRIVRGSVSTLLEWAIITIPIPLISTLYAWHSSVSCQTSLADTHTLYHPLCRIPSMMRVSTFLIDIYLCPHNNMFPQMFVQKLVNGIEDKPVSARPLDLVHDGTRMNPKVKITMDMHILWKIMQS